MLPDSKILERTSMNWWDGQYVRDALAATGRKKVVGGMVGYLEPAVVELAGVSGLVLACRG